jgi:hypothetical protein
MEERGIRREWVETVLNQPDWVEPDATQPNVLLAFGRVPDFGNRILRIVYNPDVSGFRVITAFFDRGRKGPGNEG